MITRRRLLALLPATAMHVRFAGLPTECKTGEVVFEEPRKVEAANGSFTDWFGPFEAHVYKFSRR